VTDAIPIQAEARFVTFEDLEKACLIVLRSDNPAAAHRFSQSARNIPLPEGKKLPAIPIMVLPRDAQLELVDEATMARAGWYRKEKL